MLLQREGNYMRMQGKFRQRNRFLFSNMKKLMHCILLFCLLVSVFCSSLQISVTKRQCFASGKSAYVLFNADNCCDPSEKPGTFANSNCCDFSKITLGGFVSELIFRDFFSDISIPFCSVFSKALYFHPEALFQRSFFFSHSPPKGVIQFLSFVSVFRI